MTVSSTSSRVVYTGNGVTTAWPFAFKVSQAADLVVIYTDATGSDFALSPSQYGATGFGADLGGSVTYPLTGAPIASGTKLTIYRDVAATQPTSISNQGAMWPQVIEGALDRLAMIAQGFLDTASRTLKISVTDSGTLRPLPNSTQRANSFLAFDAAGQPMAALGIGLASVSSWLATNFLPVTSAVAARAAIGAVGATDSTAFTGSNSFSQSPMLPTPSPGDSTTKGATTAFVAAAFSGAFRRIVMQKFTSSGTYSPTTGMVFCIIEVVGGGGGGGGSPSSQALVSSGSGGGGAGSYAFKLSDAAAIGTSKTVTIGAGGVGGTAGNNAGGAGGDTSVGSLCIGKGGGGGGSTAGTVSTYSTGGTGGVDGTGDITIPGEYGGNGTTNVGDAGVLVSNLSGRGGRSALGAGAPAPSSGSTAAGIAGLGWGDGGSGAYVYSTNTAATGGAGKAGGVKITEFCNI